EPRRVQRQRPGLDDGGAEGLGYLGRVHILEELHQQPRWKPKGGGQGRVFTLTVVTAIEGGDIGGQQLPLPGAEGRVPPHHGLVELGKGNPDRRFAREGALHVGVRRGRKEGHRVTPLAGTLRRQVCCRSTV